MLATLGAALAGKIALLVGGLVSIIGIYFTGRYHGAEAVKQATEAENNKVQTLNIEAQQKASTSMNQAQIDAPKTLDAIKARADNGTL